MGSWFSIDYGSVSATTIGIQASEDGYNVLVIDKGGFVSVKSINNNNSTHTLSLIPSSWCVSPRGGWIIGFKNGTVSEFDLNLNLLQSFTTPGASKAHKGVVTQLVPTKDKNTLFISTGEDNTINFWNYNGIQTLTLPISAKITAMCIANDKLFTCDTRQKVSVIDLETRNNQTYNLHSTVSYITPIPGYKGCLAALSNGQAVILSEKDLVAQFSYNNNTPIANLTPLHVDRQNGLITFYCVNEKGENSLRCLEYEIKSKSKSKPFFSVTNEFLFTTSGGKIVRYSISALAKESMSEHPQIDLPRTQIAKFFNK